MSITGDGRRGFDAWDRLKGLAPSLHKVAEFGQASQAKLSMWGDWFWLNPAAVVVPRAGTMLSRRYNTSKSKTVGEIVTLYYNFVDQCTNQEVLTDPVFSVVVLSGVDASPEDIIYGTATLEDTFVAQKIAVGVPGVVYGVFCQVSGESGHIYSVMTKVAVLSNLGSFGAGRGLYITGILPNTYAYVDYYELLDIHDGYVPYGPVTVFSGNYPIGWTPTVVGANIVTSGIANDTGTFTFTYKLVDFAGNIAYSDQVVYIPPVDIYGSIPTAGIVGVTYTGQYQSQYGMPPYQFTSSAGTVIPGVGQPNIDTCVYTGVPTTAGTYTFTTLDTDDILETDTIEATVDIFLAAAPLLVCDNIGYSGPITALVTRGAASGITPITVEYDGQSGLGGFVMGSGFGFFRVNLTTGYLAAVTMNGGAFGGDAAISPNGLWVISAVEDTGVSFTYYVYQRTGTSFTLLTSYLVSTYAQTTKTIIFSEDGTKLIHSFSPAINSGFVLVHEFNNLTGVLTTNSVYKLILGYCPYNTKMSPDNRFLAIISSTASPSNGFVAIYNTANYESVSAGIDAGCANRNALCWSRDGNYVIASGDFNGGTHNMTVNPVTSAGVISFGTRYTSGGYMSNVQVSQDGGYIAATSYETGNIEVFAINNATGVLTLSQTVLGGSQIGIWVKY
jgi:hypothetical protein